MTKRAKFEAVCFDCDSTLSRIEGIDELARRAGCEAEIAKLTEGAMNGSVPLEDVYARRLEIIRPNKEAIAWLSERYVEEMVGGAAETVEALRRHGIAVYLVTGGLLPAISALAGRVGFAPAEIHAVDINFGPTGAYEGFDAQSPLCRSDGKAIVCQQIAAMHGSLAMVGDGVTDLAARGAGAYVIGFGGITQREAVAQGADYYVKDASLTAILPALLREG